jgi:hypothetical protein
MSTLTDKQFDAFMNELIRLRRAIEDLDTTVSGGFEVSNHNLSEIDNSLDAIRSRMPSKDED